MNIELIAEVSAVSYVSNGHLDSKGGFMAHKSVPIILSEEDKNALRKVIRSGFSASRSSHLRSKIILLAAEGICTNEIARTLNTRSRTVRKWRVRFSLFGLNGLFDNPRSGSPGKFTKVTELRILSKLDEPLPEGEKAWTARLISGELGDVSTDYVWRVLRKYGIKLQRERRWRIGTDAQFVEKIADIAGLYISSNEKAIAIRIDEKPLLMIPKGTNGCLYCNDSKTFASFSDLYSNHGSTTLLDALEVATGLAKTGNFQSVQHRGFLQFMNRVISQSHEGQEMHVIIDNLNTQEKSNGTWLMSHPKVQFHYTSDNASWLNQIEVWFSVLAVRGQRNGSCISPRQIRNSVEQFSMACNENSGPFKWTSEKEYETTENRCYADLYK